MHTSTEEFLIIKKTHTPKQLFKSSASARWAISRTSKLTGHLLKLKFLPKKQQQQYKITIENNLLKEITCKRLDYMGAKTPGSCSMFSIFIYSIFLYSVSAVWKNQTSYQDLFRVLHESVKLNSLFTSWDWVKLNTIPIRSLFIQMCQVLNRISCKWFSSVCTRELKTPGNVCFWSIPWKRAEILLDTNEQRRVEFTLYSATNIEVTKEVK